MRMSPRTTPANFNDRKQSQPASDGPRPPRRKQPDRPPAAVPSPPRPAKQDAPGTKDGSPCTLVGRKSRSRTGPSVCLSVCLSVRPRSRLGANAQRSSTIRGLVHRQDCRLAELMLVRCECRRSLKSGFTGARCANHAAPLITVIAEGDADANLTGFPGGPGPWPCRILRGPLPARLGAFSGRPPRCSDFFDLGSSRIVVTSTTATNHHHRTHHFPAALPTPRGALIPVVSPSKH